MATPEVPVSHRLPEPSNYKEAQASQEWELWEAAGEKNM